MSNYPVIPSLDDNDFISFNVHSMSKCSRLKSVSDQFIGVMESSLREHIKQNGFRVYYEKSQGRPRTTIQEAWTRDGITCEVLQLGSHEWKTGKLKARIVFEFEPNEEEILAFPESPLDDIRQSLNNTEVNKNEL